MANGELVPLVNFRRPVNENNRSVSFQQTFSSSPFYVDFRTLEGSDMAGTPFRPFGVMIDNTQGAANLQIQFNDTGYRMICKKGEMLNLPYPAGPYTVAAITGEGSATVIFVDYPVDPYASELTGVFMPTEWGQIEGTLSDQIDLQNALDGKQNLIVPGSWQNIAPVNGWTVAYGDPSNCRVRRLGPFAQLYVAIEHLGGPSNQSPFSVPAGFFPETITSLFGTSISGSGFVTMVITATGVVDTNGGFYSDAVFLCSLYYVG